jgi:siroheme synthase
VPGVSAALAAPGLADIPLTHRGLSSAFVVVSGHARSSFEPVLRSLEPGSATVVVLMGLSMREAIAELLLARGWDAETPAALLLAASTPLAWTWRGSLGSLARCAIPGSRSECAGVLVVGATAAVAGRLAQLRMRDEPSRAGA